MTPHGFTLPTTRRDWLQRVGVLSGGVLLGPFSAWCDPNGTATAWAAEARPAAQAPARTLAGWRAQMAAMPLEVMDVGGGLALLSGPGGNVLVLTGADGKIVVDTFVLGVFPQLKATLDGLGPQPITTVINTHWHFDHSDNNADFRRAGARILAHTNTAQRMTESHEILILGMHFPPSPADARPTETFADTLTLDVNGERIELAYVPPAHTDTDIVVLYANANVVHTGDLFSGVSYPFIDAGTGGHITGLIAAAERLLNLVDARTRIVPGHGPLADRDRLARYRDMLVTSRDRVQKLKAGGRSLEQVQQARPTADLDEEWGGLVPPNTFVALVYSMV